jgi:DnaJ family protein C protein 28
MPNIEELIQRAIQEGKFNDLPGKGQPLRLDDNPHAEPEWQLAYHLLQENGFSLPWLELRQELEAEIEAARHAFKLACEWRLSAPVDETPVIHPPHPISELDAEFQRALRVFTEKIPQINQRIFVYNLQTPLDRFQMRKLNLEQELKRFKP